MWKLNGCPSKFSRLFVKPQGSGPVGEVEPSLVKIVVNRVSSLERRETELGGFLLETVKLVSVLEQRVSKLEEELRRVLKPV